MKVSLIHSNRVTQVQDHTAVGTLFVCGTRVTARGSNVQPCLYMMINLPHNNTVRNRRGGPLRPRDLPEITSYLSCPLHAHSHVPWPL
jgi:hypothetical protein